MLLFTTRQKDILGNLEKVVRSSFQPEGLYEQAKFRITPVDEPEKTVSSIDDVMERWLFRKTDLVNRLFSAEEAVQFLTAPVDKFPLWVKVELGENGIIELMISKRFRPFKELLHQETGHPPFKLCD